MPGLRFSPRGARRKYGQSYHANSDGASKLRGSGRPYSEFILDIARHNPPRVYSSDVGPCLGALSLSPSGAGLVSLLGPLLSGELASRDSSDHHGNKGQFISSRDRRIPEAWARWWTELECSISVRRGEADESKETRDKRDEDGMGWHRNWEVPACFDEWLLTAGCYE